MIIDLTKGNINFHIFRMAAPMTLGIFAIMTMNTADTYFVSKLGVNELATMGFIAPVVLVLFAITWGVASGAASVISRKLGGGCIEDAKLYVTHAVLLAFTVGVVFALSGYFTTDILFPLMGAEEKLLPYLHEYMDIWYWGCSLVVVQMVGNSMIRSFGNSSFPSIMMISMAIINLVLDPIMIFGLLGMPAMGLKGAAVATVISYVAVFCIAIFVMMSQLQIISYKHVNHHIFRHWRKILNIGLPAITSNLIVPVAFMITVKLVSQFGSEAVAGLAVASRVESLAFIFLYAVSSVVTPIIGQNWGAKLYPRVRNAIYTFFKLSFIWGTLIAVLMWLFADKIIIIFSDNKSVFSSAILYLHIVPISYAFFAINTIVSSFANATANPRQALMFTVLRLIVIYVPLAYMLSFFWGMAGVYLATTISNFVISIITFFWCLKEISTKENKLLA